LINQKSTEKASPCFFHKAAEGKHGAKRRKQSENLRRKAKIFYQFKELDCHIRQVVSRILSKMPKNYAAFNYLLKIIVNLL